MKHILSLIALVLLAAGPAAAVDKAVGPWNLEFSTALQMDSNSNVFYEEDNAESDMVMHIIPVFKAEYEQLKQTLFLAELRIDSSTYSGNSDASVVEADLHLLFKPIMYGAYFLGEGDYEIHQNFSPIDGLAETAITRLKAGGGFRGHHLDASLAAVSTSASYSPGKFSGLDYSQTGIEAQGEYFFESMYAKGSIETRSIDYKDSAFNDGTSFTLWAGIGKKFYPKNQVEVRIGMHSQEHGSNGEDFSGMLYAADFLHITASRKGSLRLILEKEIIPSTSVGSDFTEITAVRFHSNHQITRRIAIASQIEFRQESYETRDDSVQKIMVQGIYTPLDVMPTKAVVKKRKVAPRAWKYNWRFNGGFQLYSRTSDVAEYEFSQTRIFAGAKFVF